MSLVRVEKVSKTFRRGSGPIVYAVNEVSLAIEPGETVALIGESGSGKSTLARLVLRLHEPDSGTIEFDGRDLSALRSKELRALRALATIVFQEPYESLNPRQSVGRTIEEPLVIHRGDMSAAQRRRQVVETLDVVALNETFYDRYPHQLSGGQQQRVGVARAIVTRPKLIVLDEPTSSLDLSVRAQILMLLADLQKEFGLAYLFVSHDIHTVEYVSDRICVMYLGRIVESGPATEVIRDPRHPYTRALLSSTLSADPSVKKERHVLGGEIPSATEIPQGCVLAPRCPIASVECTLAPVPLHPIGPGHEVACIKADYLAPVSLPVV
jgi:oligopeptide/dipeptide ABC transporter ATP-binding protein